MISRHQPLIRRAHRLCVASCGLSIWIFVGFIGFGVFDRDVAGAVVVGVLAAAPFIDLAVFASNWATDRARLFVWCVWGVMALVLLGGTLVLMRSGKSDADLLLTYGTALLAFPLGLIAGPITGQLSMPMGPLQISVLWGLAIGIGSLQWFVVIPMAVRNDKHSA